MTRATSTLLAALALTACAHPVDETDADAGWETMAATISADDIRAHMTMLADDVMEGREAGTEGYERAAEYVAAEFRRIGLEPYGDGDYFQPISFFETRLLPETAGMSLRKPGATLELVFGDDFIRDGGYGSAKESITAPLVFVGHGIRAPEYAHDDFAGVDLAGRIAVVLSGAPPRFATDQRAFYSSSTGKKEAVGELGAVGLITIRTPVDQRRSPWERYLAGVGAAGMRWLADDGRPYQGFAELVGDATLSEAGAEKLFAFADRDLEAIFAHHAAGGSGSFEMDVAATLTRTSSQRTVSAPNVLGAIKGSDPVLVNQYLIYTAHLDHLGVRAAGAEDAIHNGAYDNAAGVATLLEIAEAMASAPAAARRSVLFAAVTAEEKGLQGSSYLAKHPPVRRSQIVANINIDMPFLGFPLASIEAFGAEHSTLLGPVRRATTAAGMELVPDSMPEQVRFIRSDQFSFVKEGIPALALKAGSKSSDPRLDGEAMLAEFLQKHYHRPSDDLSLPFSREGAERFARAGLFLGLDVANSSAPPRWNDGDFFGEKFAGDRKATPSP